MEVAYFEQAKSWLAAASTNASALSHDAIAECGARSSEATCEVRQGRLGLSQRIHNFSIAAAVGASGATYSSTMIGPISCKAYCLSAEILPFFRRSSVSWAMMLSAVSVSAPLSYASSSSASLNTWNLQEIDQRISSSAWRDNSQPVSSTTIHASPSRRRNERAGSLGAGGGVVLPAVCTGAE